MKFLDVFIHKPALSIAVCIFVILSGILGYQVLPLRQYPVFPVQEITVVTNYPGASPEDIQRFVTYPIEESITDIPGIDYIADNNIQNSSVIHLYLTSKANVTDVLAKVNALVSSTLWKMPPGVNTPQISVGLSSSPSLYLSLKVKDMSLEEATAYVEKIIVPSLQMVPNVANIRVRGERQYAMKLFLDPKRMSEHQVTALDIQKALSTQHIAIPVGLIKTQGQEFNITLNSTLSTPEEFNDLVIRHSGEEWLRLRDVGEAQYGAQSETSSAMIDGTPGLILFISTSQEGNDIDTVHQVLKLLPELQAKLPGKQLSLEVLWNPTHFSEAALQEVKKTVTEAVILVLAVTFLFLGSLRATLIPLVTIPLSLLGTCAILSLIGFSINTMTLLATVLSIGLVVDDAIVVLENVHRHILQGQKPWVAASLGIAEIGPAILAMTVIVAIVFVPIALVQGITGSLFREFALTISLAVILSGVFALILSPMMCRYLIQAEHGRLATTIEHSFSKVSDRYGHWLKNVLGHPKLLVLATLLLYGACVGLFKLAPNELMPQENQGVVLGLGTAPAASNADYLTQYGKTLTDLYSKIQETAHQGILFGDSSPYNNLTSFLVLKEPNPGRTEDQIIDTLNPLFQNIPGLSLFAMKRPMLADVVGLGAPLNFVIQTNGSYEELNTVVGQFLAAASQNPKLLNLSVDLHFSKPEIQVTVDRTRAEAVQVQFSDLANVLSIMLAKPTLAWFSLQGYNYPIISQATPGTLSSPSQLESLLVQSQSGELIPLSSLIHISEAPGALSLNDFERLRSATIQANLAKGYSMGEAIEFMTHTAKQLLPPQMKYDFAGESRLFVNSSGEMSFIYASVLICIYLLLVIKFNCFIDPLIILLSVPLSILGALIAIHSQGFSLNIYTQIGLVMLIGLISKHGIMLVEFANQLQEQGRDKMTAILEASKIRLKPILMTTLAMIFGALPLAFAHGAAHESLQQIGWVIVGGLFFGSCLTLFVVPTFYMLLAKTIETSEKTHD